MDTYTCDEWQTEQCDNAKFRLHSHDEYEILMFFEGDSRYVIEDKTYTLLKDDVIIVRKHEMHRIFHNTQSKYHRLVITVPPKFFTENHCPEYEHAFLESMKHTGNKIDSRTVHTSGLYDAIMRLKKYSDGFLNLYTPVANSIVVEILYIINKIVSFEKPDPINNQLKDIIAYINQNYTQRITLDMLSEQFFISKYHLCRIFREATGLTVLNYIRSKRLILANELIESGHSMTDAAMRAGFNDYSSFYRAYNTKK